MRDRKEEGGWKDGEVGGGWRKARKRKDTGRRGTLQEEKDARKQGKQEKGRGKDAGRRTVEKDKSRGDGEEGCVEF